MGEWQSRREQSDLERYFGKFCRSAHSDVNWPELIWPPVKVLGICQNKTLTGIGMFLVIHEEFPLHEVRTPEALVDEGVWKELFSWPQNSQNTPVGGLLSLRET